MDSDASPPNRGAHYHALYDGNPVPMYTWRRQAGDLVLIDVNAAAEVQTEGTAKSLIGSIASELYADDPGLLADFQQVLATRRAHRREMDYRLRRTGVVRRLMVTFIYTPGDEIVVYTEDLTELRNTETAYRELVDRLPAIAYTAQIGAETPFLFVSNQVTAMLGYRPEEWVRDARSWLNAVHPADRPAVREEENRDWKPGERMRQEYRMLDRAGNVVWIQDEAVVRVGPGESGPLIEGLMTDVTERKKFDRQLRYLADHDALTGLHNRRRFVEELTREMDLARREARSSSLMLVDIDDFKQVNDSLGHASGDDLIRAVADQLRARIRRTDTPGRLGGDEFAVTLPGSDPTAATVLAEQIRRSIAAHEHHLGRGPARVTVSIGVSDAARDLQTPDEVLAAADLALYAAKRAGRNRVVVYEPHLADELTAGRTWSSRIRQALDHDEFTLYGQPIMSLHSRTVAQHELLLRLVDPDGTVVPPGEFLPHAERAGLIIDIDHWVIRRAIALVAEAARAGSPVKVEINLTGSSLSDPTLIDLIRDEIAATGAPAHLLVFEVTETAAIANMEVAQAFAHALKALGCGLALDDFGSGFASFYYVKHLPFDYLKIDGEFVRGLRADPLDRVVVRAIVDIARTLGRQTIAEYVEDAATLELLAELGVDHAQGFHVGRPAPFTIPG